MQSLILQIAHLRKTLQDNEFTIEKMRVWLDAILLKRFNYDIRKETNRDDENITELMHYNHQP